MRNCRVLLIDDDEMIAESFRLVLEARDIDVDVATNARAAGEMLCSDAGFDVVFVDPFMTGSIPFAPEETLARIRRDQGCAIIVVLTWYGTESLANAVGVAAPSALLQKPQSLGVLADFVDQVRSSFNAAAN